MTPNPRIVDAALGTLTGRTPTLDKPGWCLSQVRIILERALFGGAWRLYDWRTRTAADKPAGVTDPWARDLEASLKAAGMALDVPRVGPTGDATRYVDWWAPETQAQLQPGDLVFRWDTAKHPSGAFIGHVAVLVARDVVLENVNPAYRASRFWNRGPTVLGPLTWPVTTVVRFDPGVPPA